MLPVIETLQQIKKRLSASAYEAYLQSLNKKPDGEKDFNLVLGSFFEGSYGHVGRMLPAFDPASTAQCETPNSATRVQYMPLKLALKYRDDLSFTLHSNNSSE